LVDGEEVKPTLSTAQTRPAQEQPRSRRDREWWSRTRSADVPPDYWETTRSPIVSLAFILPILATYEAGVAILGGSAADSVRTGADAWIRQVFGSVGMTGRLVLPMAVIGVLLIWQLIGKRSWRFSPWTIMGMAFESCALALALVGVSRLLDMGFSRLEAAPLMQVGESRQTLALLGYLGAGVYEEALFRLGLVPLLFQGLRLLHMPMLFSSTLAVTGSALMFSLAHHAGGPGETFTWFAFVFRWTAGVFFAGIFLGRGFGVAVGTHAAYDILVGLPGLP
jgi:hypothetical protein